jgi:hypothetical protein
MYLLENHHQYPQTISIEDVPNHYIYTCPHMVHCIDVKAMSDGVSIGIIPMENCHVVSAMKMMITMSSLLLLLPLCDNVVTFPPGMHPRDIQIAIHLNNNTYSALPGVVLEKSVPDFGRLP